MNFEPQKFFIGLIDFFAIIMPGAALAYQLRGDAANPLGSFETGVVFLFASYLLGHLISLLGSPLDEYIYKPLRECTDFEQIKQLAKATKKKEAGKKVKLAPAWLRRLAKSQWLFHDADEPLKHIVRLKIASLDRLSASDAVNAFQWSKIRLGKDHPVALLEVNRFEANSKFFRSFTVVLAILVIFYATRGCAGYALICLALLFPALWRYIDQRFKSIQQAYWSVLTIDAASAAERAKPASVAAPTYAGGVVTRTDNGSRKYLLITATHNHEEWVLPKGHIEVEENAKVAAIREVYEEAGCWTCIREHLRTSSLDSSKPGPIVHWYLMDLIEECEDWPEESRQREWLTLPDAEKKRSFPETRELLKVAAEKLGDPNFKPSHSATS